MRRLWLKLHLYGGLITCWYLLIYGWSSLAFNHEGLLPQSNPQPIHWERSMADSPAEPDLTQAEFVRDRLDLFGWPLPWSMKRTASGALWFEMLRPGRKYTVEFDPGTRLARVQEERTGLKTVIIGLHGLAGGIPNSPWMSTWSWYTQITTGVAFLSIGSGIYLWLIRTRKRLMAVTLLFTAVLSSAALFLYVWRLR